MTADSRTVGARSRLTPGQILLGLVLVGVGALAGWQLRLSTLPLLLLAAIMVGLAQQALP